MNGETPWPVFLSAVRQATSRERLRRTRSVEGFTRETRAGMSPGGCFCLSPDEVPIHMGRGNCSACHDIGLPTAPDWRMAHVAVFRRELEPTRNWQRELVLKRDVEGVVALSQAAGHIPRTRDSGARCLARGE